MPFLSHSLTRLEPAVRVSNRSSWTPSFANAIYRYIRNNTVNDIEALDLTIANYKRECMNSSVTTTENEIRNIYFAYKSQIRSGSNAN